MKKYQDQKGNVVPIVLGVVLLAVVGFAAYTVMYKKDKDTTMTAAVVAAPSSGTKAADLRSALVSLGVQHMNLTAQAVDAALDGNADAGAYGKVLYANGDSIGAAVGSVYGKEAETTFNTVWKLHLDQFVAYAVAGKKGDAAGKAAALKAIDTGYTKPLSAYLAKANPNLPEATLDSVLGEHVTMTAKMIDAHNAGDYTAEANELILANKHIEGIFSTLAGAIVKQYPAKF
jgi:hypothetical protein